MLPELHIGQSAILTDIAMCIAYYRMASPGMYCCIHTAVQLDAQTRLCPGVLVMVNYGKHKQCSANPSHTHFVGAPNFVLDVFGEDESEYRSRRASYERAGVIEYVALRETDPLSFHWNRRVDGKFTEIEADEPGMIYSSALPGLWVPTEALKNRNWWAIMASISQGITRRGHHEMMDSIWRKE